MFQVLSNKIEDVNKVSACIYGKLTLYIIYENCPIHDLIISSQLQSKKPETKRNKTLGKTKETTQLTKTPKQTAKKEAKKTPQETLLTKLKSKSTPAKSGTPSTSKSSRKKAKVAYYTGETKSEYFNETSTKNFSSESLSDDDEDFEIPALKTPKRGRSGGSRPVEPRQHAPAGGETSGIVKKGQ